MFYANLCSPISLYLSSVADSQFIVSDRYQCRSNERKAGKIYIDRAQFLDYVCRLLWLNMIISCRVCRLAFQDIVFDTNTAENQQTVQRLNGSKPLITIDSSS